MQPVAMRRADDHRRDKGPRTRMMALGWLPHTGSLVCRKTFPPGATERGRARTSQDIAGGKERRTPLPDTCRTAAGCERAGYAA